MSTKLNEASFDSRLGTDVAPKREQEELIMKKVILALLLLPSFAIAGQKGLPVKTLKNGISSDIAKQFHFTVDQDLLHVSKKNGTFELLASGGPIPAHGRPRKVPFITGKVDIKTGVTSDIARLAIPLAIRSRTPGSVAPGSGGNLEGNK
jgi:hypothetical protein